MSYLSKLHQSWGDIPVIKIDYKNINYIIPVPVYDTSVPTLVSAFANGLKDKATSFVNMFKGAANEKKRTTDLYALNNLSGTILPATTTLILAPPGFIFTHIHIILSTYTRRYPPHISTPHVV